MQSLIPATQTYLDQNNLILIDSIEMGSGSNLIHESKPGSSCVENLTLQGITKTLRYLNNYDGMGGRFIDYNLGKRKGLQADKMYVLEFAYPDDGNRSMIFINHADETREGVSTGPALVNTLNGYLGHNAASFSFPISRTWQKHQFIFHMLDHMPNSVMNGKDFDARTKTSDQGVTAVIAHYPFSSAPYIRASQLLTLSFIKLSIKMHIK